MPSLSSKDRVSLCRFTFDDGRRCRTPRISTSPDFCFYHAQKEAQFHATEKIANDLAFFFSSDYLSANDLNTALGRVFVAVARGQLKPRSARTLAYLAQTMLQTLHLAQNELISACGNSDWHDSIIKSLNANYDYRFPSPSQPAPPQTPAQPTMPTRPESVTPQSQTAPQPSTPPPATPNPAPPPQTCHSERSEGPRRDPSSSTTTETHQSPAAPPTPMPNATSSPVETGLARPEPPTTRPDSQLTPGPILPAPQTPNTDAPPASQPAPPSPRPRPGAPTRDPYAVHYGPNYRLIVDGKPF
ncbi:MAG: hypothetical protein WA621_00380 [Candidatus Acidiferrum sp.]